MTSNHDGAIVAVLTGIGGKIGHVAGDYLVQNDAMALHKQDHTRPDCPRNDTDTRTPADRIRDGRRALTIHALSYGLTQAAVKAALYRVAGARVPLLAQLAGAVTETSLHALIDDGRLLHWFAHAKGSGPFYNTASGGVNGRMLLDQAVHEGIQLFAGTVVTTLIARRLARPHRIS